MGQTSKPPPRRRLIGRNSGRSLETAAYLARNTKFESIPSSGESGATPDRLQFVPITAHPTYVSVFCSRVLGSAGPFTSV
jgi:hypothetical protein